jgi:predicted Fe-S protein YdhL (DUF1289 family)
MKELPTMADADVPSPCIDVCRMDPVTGWCEGCRRTLDEIAAWSQLDNAAKRAVWLQLQDRRSAVPVGANKESR